MKISVYMASSLDGFIADEQGGVDWLNNLSSDDASNEDYGYHEFLSTVDRLVMGRNTFDQVLGFEQWPYGRLPVSVLTRQAAPEAVPDGAILTFTSGSPQRLYNQFVSEGLQHIYLDGGEVVRQFLDAGLVDEIIITQVPALLGNGIRLFHKPLTDEWRMHKLQNYPNGVVQTHLLKKRADPLD